MAAAADLDFDPVELLSTELQAPDRARRLRAVKGLPAVAIAVGAEAARSRVCPLVEEHVAREEEDEVQFRAATALNGKFVRILGGADHAHLVLASLDRLRAAARKRPPGGARPSEFFRARGAPGPGAKASGRRRRRESVRRARRRSGHDADAGLLSAFDSAGA